MTSTETEAKLAQALELLRVGASTYPDGHGPEWVRIARSMLAPVVDLTWGCSVGSDFPSLDIRRSGGVTARVMSGKGYPDAEFLARLFCAAPKMKALLEEYAGSTEAACAVEFPDKVRDLLIEIGKPHV